MCKHVKRDRERETIEWQKLTNENLKFSSSKFMVSISKWEKYVINWAKGPELSIPGEGRKCT